jgi:hypothetical protein
VPNLSLITLQHDGKHGELKTPKSLSISPGIPLTLPKTHKNTLKNQLFTHGTIFKPTICAIL